MSCQRIQQIGLICGIKAGTKKKGPLLPQDFTRRRFLQTAAASTALALPIVSSAQTKPATAPATTAAALPPPPKLKLGIIGVGGRGWDHVREISAIPSAEIIALCDVDVNNLVNAARTVTAAKTFVDFREMLKLPELQAVVVATPDHNHAPITAAALRANKHVYCEKP